MTKGLIKSAAVAMMMWAATAGASDTALELENQYKDLAETLSSSQNKFGSCAEVEAYTSDIIEAATKSRQYFDQNWEQNKETGRKFTLGSETLKAMKTTLALKDIMRMLDHRKPKTFEHALNRVIMWGPAPGAYGNMSYLEFGENNKVTVAKLNFIDDHPWTQWETVEATFSVVKRGHELIVLVGADEYFLRQSFEYGARGMWVLIPTNDSEASPWLKGFTDISSECEA